MTFAYGSAFVGLGDAVTLARVVGLADLEAEALAAPDAAAEALAGVFTEADGDGFEAARDALAAGLAAADETSVS